MNNSSSKGIWIVIVVIVLVILGVFAFSGNGDVTETPNTDTATTTDTVATTTSSTSTSTAVITVIEPGKNESWKIGTKEIVTWKFAGSIPVTYKVALVLEPGFIPLGIVGATSTSFTYTVPQTICLGGDACMDATTSPEPRRVKVMLYDQIECLGFCLNRPGNLISEDTSDGQITIIK